MFQSKSTMIADCVSVAYWFDNLVSHLKHSVEFSWGNFFEFTTLDTFHLAMQLMMQHRSTCPPPCANTNRDTSFRPFPRSWQWIGDFPIPHVTIGTRCFLLKPPLKVVGSYEHLKGDKRLRGFVFRKSLLDFWLATDQFLLESSTHEMDKGGFMKEGLKVTKQKNMCFIQNHMVNMRDIGIPKP